MEKLKIGKKGGAKQITSEIKKIRNSRISRNVFRIVDENNELEKAKLKLALK
jgi:hypothetical protein